MQASLPPPSSCPATTGATAIPQPLQRQKFQDPLEHRSSLVCRCDLLGDGTRQLCEVTP